MIHYYIKRNMRYDTLIIWTVFDGKSNWTSYVPQTPQPVATKLLRSVVISSRTTHYLRQNCLAGGGMGLSSPRIMHVICMWHCGMCETLIKTVLCDLHSHITDRNLIQKWINVICRPLTVILNSDGYSWKFLIDNTVYISLTKINFGWINYALQKHHENRSSGSV